MPQNIHLYVAEYVITEPQIERPKYRYQRQDENGKLLSRWDNAAHYPHISTFPHHRHTRDGKIEATPSMDISQILQNIVGFLPA